VTDDNPAPEDGDELRTRTPPVEELSAPPTPSKGRPQTPPLDELPSPATPHLDEVPPAATPQLADDAHRPRTPPLVDLPAPKLRWMDVATDAAAGLAAAAAAIHDGSQAAPAVLPAVEEAPRAQALSPVPMAVDNAVAREPIQPWPAAAAAAPMPLAAPVAVPAASALRLGATAAGTTRAAVRSAEPTLRPDAPEFAGIPWKMWESALPRQLRDCIEEIRRIDAQITALKRQG